MKSIKYIIIAFSAEFFLIPVKKKIIRQDVTELEHHYYAIFVPNNNTGVTVSRTQTALVKFPVQFYSTFTRDYDAVAKYAVVTTGITAPAQRGVDFNIVIKTEYYYLLQIVTYTMIFPQAKQAMDTIYIKLLNNPAPGASKLKCKCWKISLDNLM